MYFSRAYNFSFNRILRTTSFKILHPYVHVSLWIQNIFQFHFITKQLTINFSNGSLKITLS